MHHPFRHEAVPYAGTGQFVALAVTMLRDALDRDERPLLLAEPARLGDVRDALGPDADGVALVSTDEHGRNPSRLLTMMHSFMLAGDGRRTLALSEPTQPSQGSATRAEAVLAENVLNASPLHGWAMSVVCMYDTESLDDDAITEMHRSHPVLRGEPVDNDEYEPYRLQKLYGSQLPPAPDAATTVEVVGHQLGRMREVVQSAALGWGVAPDRVDDLVLAVNEIVTNSIRHADGRATLRLWCDGRSAVCEVRDGGWLPDPLIGRLAPDPARANGRGLWLAHHLCDLVQIRSTTSGTVVRLFVDC
ncbi:anti-sigma factor RsbA family regulatory protein [uncultured Jatrophihabitans sp.]|uniref:anti-sigma factor RsbA family regulatory protein n=1 Tax=uncultured Jatrophihabitans sp. TaxID=1610747 RepID=UPI0035C966B5